MFCEMSNFTLENLLLAVDLNVQLQNNVKVKINNLKYEEKLIDLIQREELIDFILDKNPDRKLFTWKNSKNITRIDTC